jgi:hypothetical protein
MSPQRLAHLIHPTQDVAPPSVLPVDPYSQKLLVVSPLTNTQILGVLSGFKPEFA